MLLVLHSNCLSNLTQEQVENRASISVDARTLEQVWEQVRKLFCNSLGTAKQGVLQQQVVLLQDVRLIQQESWFRIGFIFLHSC